MLQDILTQTNSTVAAVTAVVAVIVLTLTSFFNIVSIYERDWSRRHHKILTELRAVETSQGQFTRYLDEAIYLESFRIASGVSANRSKADFLLRLALIGHWNRWQLRQIARFIVVSPERSTPTLKITAWDTVSARFSLYFGIFFMALGAILGFIVMMKGATIGAFYAGMGIEIAFVVVAAFIMSGYNKYKVARRFQEYLKNNPQILCNEEPAPSQELSVTRTTRVGEEERAAA
ncbi:hypothetical protein PS925_01056 [Pseudomonas fluorescens]|uniref:Uncharacterized protein n=1 Tax=Pseudomonas fluorescens TaxID=294 RepID=A0A5E7SKJ6_PSEFL|nr:hypothetical protein [Pseudomonas fluorescens]VVP87292.1 hypothetical protein PS925_01056 [Pseudomonas fluorescens]